MKLKQNKNGSIPLFEEGFFPWNALPYPCEHAQLGLDLEKQGDKKVVKLKEWQLNTLDHNQEPIAALFTQKGWQCRSQLITNNLQLNLPPVQPTVFCDQDNGWVLKRDLETTMMACGTGCKSGVGAFLRKDCGVLNFGPAMGEEFGIAGVAKDLLMEQEGTSVRLKHRTSISAYHSRPKPFPHLADSGNSYLQMVAEHQLEEGQYAFKAYFEGEKKERVHFEFFIKADLVKISTLHRLRKNTLDHYQGPAQAMEFLGAQGRIELRALQGVTSMEVRALQEKEREWEADFLVVYRLDPCETLEFEIF